MMFGVSGSVIDGLIGNGGFIPDGNNAVAADSQQQQCAQQAQREAVRAMFCMPWMRGQFAGAAFKVRGLLEPERTTLAGRPWMDVQ